MYERILFPTDGSDGSTAALDHAVDLAEKYDATLHGLYVVDQRTYAGLANDTDRESIRKSREAAGEEALRGVEESATGVAVETTLTFGVPDEEIVDAVSDHDIDLVVMGSHGRTGVRRAILGSTTENVLRRSSVPVHVVPVGDA